MAFFSLNEMRELGSETFRACFRSHSYLARHLKLESYDLVLGLGLWETPVIKSRSARDTLTVSTLTLELLLLFLPFLLCI